LRRTTHVIVFHPWFEWFILLCIAFSSVLLALDDPSADFAPAWLDALEMFFLAVFLLELVLKVVSMGLIGAKGAYLRKGWNILDASIIIIGVVSAAIDPGPGRDSCEYCAALKVSLVHATPVRAHTHARMRAQVLRTFRLLRPLRLISRFEGLRLVVNAIIASVPVVIQVCCRLDTEGYVRNKKRL
jgi:voltage-dependent calcium channel T type alpha-1G